MIPCPQTKSYTDITNLHQYVRATYTWLFAFAWEQTNALVKKTLGGWAFTIDNIV